MNILRRTILIGAALICLLTPVSAQEAAPSLSAAQIAARIKTIRPKTVILVFDVTESTRHNGVFSQERAASATIIRQGCRPGDRVALIQFGTASRMIFDQTLSSRADADALIDRIPGGVEPGHGTNIREPHHKALQMISEGLPQPGIIVLLTDSFNDRPLETDPDYPKYLSYYTLKGLTVYPDSPENRDYERLLRMLKASGKLTQFGVGVGIAPTGRPIERLPVGPGQGDSDAGETTLAPTILKPAGSEKPHNAFLLIVMGLAALILLAAVAYLLANRSVPVRLKLGDKGAPRDYRLRPGAKINLGGSLTSGGPTDEVFPLSGVASPSAAIQSQRGGAVLIPVKESTVSLFHNGILLERPTPLRIGDEIRIALPATETEAARDIRIHFADPKTAAF